MGLSSILLENEVFWIFTHLRKKPVLQHCEMRYPSNRVFSKKNGPWTFVCDRVQNTLTFGESLSCSSASWGFCSPHMWTLCRFTFPLRWNIALSLKIKHGRKVSSSMFWSIQSQNSTPFRLSFGWRACTSCKRYGLNSKWRLNTRQTVGCGIPSSLLTLQVDLRGLRSKLWIRLTFSSDTHGRPSFCLYTDSLFAQIDDSNNKCSSSLEVECWNEDETHTAQQSPTQF